MTSLKEINLKHQWALFLSLILKYVVKMVNVPFLNINTGNLILIDSWEITLRGD